MTMSLTAPVPEFSVIIGRVSTVDTQRIFDLLRALRQQIAAPAFEIIVADRINDDVTARIEREFAEVRLLPLPAAASLPQLRTAALRVARGRYIVVTEDHCIPCLSWLNDFAIAFANWPAAAAHGGAVQNGETTTTLDWATYLCEYAEFAPPFEEHGQAKVKVPGMNIAYRKDTLNAASCEQLENGFWESTLHPQLDAAAQRIRACLGAVVTHRKRIPLAMFAQQRFWYSRYFAGTRWQPAARLSRAIAAALTPALPVLLLTRIATAAWRRPTLRRPLLRSLPLLTGFVLVAAAGELVGYVAGPGNALRRLE